MSRCRKPLKPRSEPEKSGGGTRATLAPIDPLYLAWIAANRITLGGNLRAPAERLSLDKALRAVTIEAAQVIGMDHMVGSIAAWQIGAISTPTTRCRRFNPTRPRR